MKYHRLCLSAGLIFTLVTSTAVNAFSVPQPQSAIQASKVAHIQLKASQGEKEAQFLLGLMYLSGRFVDQDQYLGAKWISNAAEQGHPKAQQTLADLSFEGSIIERDLAMAEHWYLSLSEQGSKWAQFRLGFIYAAGGEGVERNCGKAVERFNSVGDEVSLGNVAWILATCPEAKYRNGDRALALAQSLVESNHEDPTNLDNLAAAYAETGDYIAAVETQQKAIDALKNSEMISRSDEFELRLQTYQENKPFREIVPLMD
ncbi:SEL1-like repeat protein [Shewanella eurypsychrophilus]|uniref:SEL1-like repeat protein n=1 Tax=Shewanella eurypsychrophilus TaxID=2593656 RepID=A0ABX6VCR9_9GAMM|nr:MULTISPECIES: SEL1-like repeat protein [Shewanella]QFU24405.1 sel1 repeat family protein [Shewanella sp. YLB-09]QPG59605.1 SEL1-like repeat protein [Shewanella eurypsychrophilus]